MYRKWVRKRIFQEVMTRTGGMAQVVEHLL
jgi:hypothetical protein